MHASRSDENSRNTLRERRIGMSTDLPLEAKRDLKQAIDELVRNKYDAMDVMVYVTLKWKVLPAELAKHIESLKLKAKDKLIIVGRKN